MHAHNQKPKNRRFSQGVRNNAPKPDFFSSQVLDAQRFYLNLAPPEDTELTVVSAGWERCAPDYRMVRSTFPYLSVEYVAEGRGELALGGRDWKLSPGTAFSYAPGVEHAIRTDPDHPMLKYFVDFAGTRPRRLLRQASLTPGSVVRVSAPNEVTGVFDQLVSEGKKDSRYTAAMCVALVEYLLLKLADVAVPYDSGETKAFATYQRCRQQIQQQYNALQTAEQAAAACQVDLAYLCRLFKRFDHVSPYQYLVRLKMNRAAELLQQPGRLVKQVAEELAFSDPYHFSRVFKRVHGVSPGQFVRLRGTERSV